MVRAPPGDRRVVERLTPGEAAFVRASIRRRRLFLALSVAGLAVAAGLLVYYGIRRFSDPGFPLGMRSVLVILILLNARQNLRQYRYTGALSKLRPPEIG